MEGGYCEAAAISDGDAKNLPKENLMYGMSLYSLRTREKIAILDLDRNLVYDRGSYLTKKRWKQPDDVGPFRGVLPKSIKESDWAFGVGIISKSLFSRIRQIRFSWQKSNLDEDCPLGSLDLLHNA